MRKASLVFIAVAWLAVPSCMFVHDGDCETNADCKSGRVCDNGTCVDSEGGNNVASGGNSEGSGATSGGTSGGTDPNGPSCTVLRAGSQIASVADNSFCGASTASVSVRIASGGLIESIDSRSCSLIQPGSSCYSVFPDRYQCGDCEFEVGSDTIMGTTLYSLGPASCSQPGCAAYCCRSESLTYAAGYYLETSSSGSGSGSSSGGANDACSQCSQACAGIPGCSCCAECGGFCYN